MTDQNNLARKQSVDTSEDDPLEELARIVSGGLDEFNPDRPSRGRQEEAPARQDARHETLEDAAADMEAELMRGFTNDMGAGDDAGDDERAPAEIREPRQAASRFSSLRIADEPVDEDRSESAAENDYPHPEQVDPSLEDQLMAELDHGRGRVWRDSEADSDRATDRSQETDTGYAASSHSAPAREEAENPEQHQPRREVPEAPAGDFAAAFRLATADPYVRQRQANLEARRSTTSGGTEARDSRPQEPPRSQQTGRGSIPVSDFASALAAANASRSVPARDVTTPTLPERAETAPEEEEYFQDEFAEGEQYGAEESAAAAETAYRHPEPEEQDEPAASFDSDGDEPEMAAQSEQMTDSLEFDLSSAFRQELEQRTPPPAPAEPPRQPAARYDEDELVELLQADEPEQEVPEPTQPSLEDEFALAFERELQLDPIPEQPPEPARNETDFPQQPAPQKHHAPAARNDTYQRSDAKVAATAAAPKSEPEPEPESDDPLAWLRDDKEPVGPGPLPDVLTREQASDDDPLADVEWYDDFDVDQLADDEFASEGEPKSASRGGFRLAGIALVTALVLGGGVLGFLYLTGGDDAGEAPVIRADSEPVKVKPDDPGGTTIENQDKASYERVTGDFANETRQEQLLNTTEEPIDVSALAAQDEAPRDVRQAGQSSLQPDPDSSNVIGFEEKADERLTPDAALSRSASETPLLAPRRVRTVTVKPDGTVVEPDLRSEVAAAESVASDTPATTRNEGTIDGARSTGEIAVPTPRPDRLRSAAEELTTDSTARGELISSSPQRPASTEPVFREVSSEASGETADTGGSSPAGTQTASLAPESGAVARPQQSEWAVQVASRRTAEDAQSTFQVMRRDYPDILQERQMSVQRAQIEGRGTFFRVRVMADSRDDAVDLCTRLKSAGGSCFVTR